MRPRVGTTEKKHSSDGSLTVSELVRREQSWADEQPIVAACGFCPWTFEGTVAEGRVAAATHRQQQHPDAKPGRMAREARERERNLREAEKRRQRAEREEEIGLHNGVADGIHVVLPEEPHDASKRLLGMLGASYEVVDGEPAPPHLTVVDELEREPVEEDAATARAGSSSTSSRAGVTRAAAWTRDEAIAAVQAFAREHGHPPSSTIRGEPSVPSAPAAKRLFGSWADMIVAAGFDRPTKGTRYKDSSGHSDEQEPTAETPPSAPPPAEVAQLERAPATPAGDAGSTPALRSAVLDVLESLRALVDVVLPEPPE